MSTHLYALLHKQRSTLVLLLFTFGTWAALRLEPGTLLPPRSWNIITLCVWTAYILTKGLGRLSVWDKRELVWAVLSCAALLQFLAQDLSFRNWGDVYYFCGSHMEYCTCSYRWNTAGWVKAAVLWNFVLSSALGVQRLLIQLGLKGLLPGEEIVTRESFVSIGWRLIPYWLNNWEQHWGAECSSVVFELPYFAVELLVILPSVQILCSRMKVLATPVVYTGQAEVQDGVEVIRAQYAPNVLKGCWERAPEQRSLRERLRKNRRVMAFTAAVILLAAANAIAIPLQLEDQILQHPKTDAVLLSGQLTLDWSSAAQLQEVVYVIQGNGSRLGAASQPLLSRARKLARRRLPSLEAVSTAAAASRQEAGSVSLAAVAQDSPSAAAAAVGLSMPAVGLEDVLRPAAAQHPVRAASAAQALLQWLEAYLGPSGPQGCPAASPFRKAVGKHFYEVSRVQTPRHRTLIPLVEAALAVMRLSCEKFPVLLSLYVAHLLFWEPPPWAAALVAFNGRLSSAWQRVVLLSFPAVCWLYGAGVVFSTFVSVVFWGGPVSAAYEAARRALFKVHIAALHPATPEELERMGGNCAICWGDMTPVGHQPHTSSSSSSRAGTAGVGVSRVARSDDGYCEAEDRDHQLGADISRAATSGSSSSGSSSQQARQACEDSAAAVAAPMAGRQGTGALRQRRRWWQSWRAGRDRRHPPAAATPAAATPAPVGGQHPGCDHSQQQRHCHQHVKDVASSSLVADVAGAGQEVEQGDQGASTTPRNSSSSSSGAREWLSRTGSGSLPAAAVGVAQQQPQQQQEEEELLAGQERPLPDAPRALHGAGPAPPPPITTPAWSADSAGSMSPTAAASEGWSLPCGHAFHSGCLVQWLQQCHATGVSPKCPMCQGLIKLQVRLQLPRLWSAAAAGAPGLPAPAVAGAAGAGGAAAAAGGLGDAGMALGGAGVAGMGAAGGLQPINNYLLIHQPHLADLLLDMPQILALEHQQLVQEVQDLQQQRQQLLEDLQLHRQELQELQGRQQQLQAEMEMEAQQRQLQGELAVLRRLQELLRQQQEQQQQVVAARGQGPQGVEAAAAVADLDGQQQQQQVQAEQHVMGAQPDADAKEVQDAEDLHRPPALPLQLEGALHAGGAAAQRAAQQVPHAVMQAAAAAAGAGPEGAELRELLRTLLALQQGG